MEDSDPKEGSESEEPAPDPVCPSDPQDSEDRVPVPVQTGGFKLPSLPGAQRSVKSSDPPASDADSTEIPIPDQSEKVAETEPEPIPEDTTHSAPQKAIKSPAELLKAKSLPLPYQEPSWGGVPSQQYYLEVLKNGTIVDTIQLRDKSYFVVGRLANCDVLLEHPSLSRYHAVLQFKSQGSPEKPVGFYLFDLDSTHGSFHNKNKCFPKTYYRLRVGHMLKFGLSTRSLILQGPEEDSEEESELSITELKSLAAEKARRRQEEKKTREEKAGKENEDSGENESGAGISWGMGDDADEFPDMEQNPFAETADNESLYLSDPKKALKNWFDREGYELEFEIEEKGYAQFLCKINLPVDSGTGGSTIAEALVKGKKKEATVQAALEACRILDRMGLLRPSQQSAIEKKVKKWEEDDFYASDDDEFLDRTGSIEKKRKSRMRLAGKEEDVVETYDSLVKKHEESSRRLGEYEKELKEALARKERAEKRSESLDLDNYLSELRKGAQVDKETIQKLKMKILTINKDLERLTKLINIAKPASLPQLKSPSNPEKSKRPGIMIGKRGSKGLMGKIKTVDNDVKTPVFVSSTDTKVLEAFLNDTEDDRPRRSRPMDLDDTEEDVIQPIGYEEKPEPTPKERIGDTSINKPLRMMGPSVPVGLKSKGEEESPEGENPVKPALETDFFNPSSTAEKVHELMELQAQDDEADAASGEKKTRQDRGSKRRKKAEEGEEEEEYYKVGMDKKYDVWVPPTNQTGDGRTSLNDKLGY